MPSTTTDEETVLDLHHGFVDANTTGDTSYLRAHMAPGPEGFRWYNLNKSVYVGMDHIIRLWDFLVAMGGSAECPILEEQVRVNGDVAWVTYIMGFHADFGAMGKVIAERALHRDLGTPGRRVEDGAFPLLGLRARRLGRRPLMATATDTDEARDSRAPP